MTEKTLYRSKTDRFLGGVCGGIAEYFDIPSWLVRVIWVVLTIVPIPFIVSIAVYAVMWYFVPDGPDKIVDPNVIDADYKVE